MTRSSDQQPVPSVDLIEATLRDLLLEAPLPTPGPRGAGRPPVVPALWLWLGILVAVLRGFTAQRKVWQLLTIDGLWQFKAPDLTEQAIYDRLARVAPNALQTLFRQITTTLLRRFQAVSDVPYAPFAKEIIALDHSTLDPVLRKLAVLRGLPKGDPALLPGQLAALFDVRRQLWTSVELWTDAQRHVSNGVEELLEHVPRESLLLCDLGYFSFAWFDLLTDRGYYWISRVRARTSFQVLHVLYSSPGMANGQPPGGLGLRESLVYMGKYAADRARNPVRLIEVVLGNRTFRYFTNVLDPRQLPAQHVVELYRRRWDIEQAFNLLKTHLKLYLLWSAHANLILNQVFATLIIAQVILALRIEIAVRAQADLREVSLSEIIIWIPQLAAQGKDPIELLATRGRKAGIIRPYRGQEYAVPEPPWSDYVAVPEPPPPRKPRYAGKKSSGGKGGDGAYARRRSGRKRGGR